MVTVLLDDSEDTEIVIIETRRRRRRRPARVVFGVPHFVPADHPEGRKRPMAIKVPNDAIAAVPLVFTDLEGHNLAGSVDGPTVSVADPSVATVQLTSDGQWVNITPLVATGASTVTYQDAVDNITATLDFSIVEPQPVSAAFNEGAVVLTANPTPPAGAPGGPTPSVSGGAGGADTTGGAGTGADTTGGAGAGPATAARRS